MRVITHRRRHLRRLAVVLGAGILLSAAASLVQIELSFGIAAILGLLAVAALGQVISVFRRTRQG